MEPSLVHDTGCSTGETFRNAAGQLRKFCAPPVHDTGWSTEEMLRNAAGQLNAVLGGPMVDSMQLMMATEEERIKILKQGVLSSGKSFDSMSKFEKMALANAAGITDMAQASAVFSEKARAMKSETDGAAMSQEDLEKVQKAAVSVTQDFTLIMQQFAVLVGPILTGLKFMTTGLLSVFDALRNLTKAIGFGSSLLLDFALGFVFLKTVIWALSGAFSFLFGSLGTGLLATLTAAGTGIMTFIGGIGTSLVALGSSILGFFTTILGALVTGVVSLFTALGTAIAAMLAPLANPLVMAGALVFVGVMAGIGAAAAGVGLLVSSFKELISVVMDNAAKLPEVMKGIAGLAAAFAPLAASLAFAGTAMAGLAVASALAVIPTLAASLSIGLLALSFSSLAESASVFSQAMRDLNSQGGVTEFINVVKTIDDANINNLEELIDEADRLVMVQAKIAAMDTANSISSAIDKLISVVAPETSGGQPRTRDVVLKINDTEFARAVVEALDDDMKLSLG